MVGGKNKKTIWEKVTYMSTPKKKQKNLPEKG